MALISLKQIAQHTSNETVEEGTYNLVYRVRMSSGLDGPVAVRQGMAAIGIRHGAIYADNNAAFLTTIALSQSFPTLWIATATFSTKRQLAATGNPVDDPVDIEWNSERNEEVIKRDRDGRAITNSAGDPYNPPPVHDVEGDSVHVDANTNASVGFFRQFRNKVNLSPFIIDGETIGAERAYFTRLRVSRNKTRGSTGFRNVKFVLLIADDDNPDGWKHVELDAGFRRGIEGSPNQNPPHPRIFADHEKILNADGTDPTEPVLLDGDGQPLKNAAPENSVFNTWNTRFAIEFAGNLPGCLPVGP